MVIPNRTDLLELARMFYQIWVLVMLQDDLQLLLVSKHINKIILELELEDTVVVLPRIELSNIKILTVLSERKQ